jgi:hypothetical protein
MSDLVRLYRDKQHTEVSHRYQQYMYQQRYNDFVLSNGQVITIINNLIPLINSIKFN